MPCKYGNNSSRVRTAANADIFGYALNSPGAFSLTTLSVDWAEITTMTINWYRLPYSSGCFFPLYFLSKGRIATDQLTVVDIRSKLRKSPAFPTAGPKTGVLTVD